MTTALITGASAGIGAAFAQELASRGTNLVLVARSQNKLEDLAELLRSQYRVNVDVIAQDLTAPHAATTIFEATQAMDCTIDLLINNAGTGDYGDFAERDRDLQLQTIQLNVTALVDLTHHFLLPMRQRRSGSIINLASVAAFQSMPYFSIYAATKAFILSFSEALWAENRNYGVHVLAVCPGPAGKQFFQQAGFPPTLVNLSSVVETPAKVVVQDALTALEKRHSIVIPGNPSNQILATLPRFIPRDLVASFWKLVLGAQR
ncbi:SDR family oxidoreductase [Cyanobacteria bacterium FACHB-63]|nr:SDR family oxidoreductase [Cyanobacteria bacterium FACHB-63]